MSVAIFSALLIDIRSLQSKHFVDFLFIPFFSHFRKITSPILEHVETEQFSRFYAMCTFETLCYFRGSGKRQNRPTASGSIFNS